MIIHGSAMMAVLSVQNVINVLSKLKHGLQPSLIHPGFIFLLSLGLLKKKKNKAEWAKYWFWIRCSFSLIFFGSNYIKSRWKFSILTSQKFSVENHP